MRADRYAIAVGTTNSPEQTALDVTTITQVQLTI